VGLSVPVGRLPAEEAIELADLADEYGSGEVRLSRAGRTRSSST